MITTLVETVKAGGQEAERHEMPNGTTSCWYIDENHSYWRHNAKTGKKGTRLTGVTTAVKPLDFKPDGLMKWAAKTQLKGAAMYLWKLNQGGELDDAEHASAVFEALELFENNPDLAWQILAQERLTYDDVREQKADQGTKVHEQALRALAEGRQVPDTEGMTDTEKGLSEAVHNFWFDLNPKVIAHEYVVCDPDLGVAGRPDLLCELHLDGGLAGNYIVDLKTGGFIAIAHHAQVAGYRKMSDSGGFPQTAGGLILQVSPDGTYRLIPVQATPEDFELGVLAYRAAGRIDNAARRARG